MFSASVRSKIFIRAVKFQSVPLNPPFVYDTPMEERAILLNLIQNILLVAANLSLTDQRQSTERFLLSTKTFCKSVRHNGACIWQRNVIQQRNVFHRKT